MHITFLDVQDWERAPIKHALKDHELLLQKESADHTNTKELQKTEVLSVFVYSHCDEEFLSQLPKLKLIVTRSTGYDHIDMGYCKKHHIQVANVPFYGENTVAEHTFALILALSRNVHKSYMRTIRSDFSIEGLVGFDLKGKTLGVLGAGHIGQHVIRIARGFGMNVIAFDTRQDHFLAEVLGFQYGTVDDVLKASDIVTLHVPYLPSTHHMIDAVRLSLMKKGALLINTARGAVVDTSALIDALDRGHLGGAGLDVVEGEDDLREEKELLHRHSSESTLAQVGRVHVLLNRENVVYTPHIGFYSEEALGRIITTSLENIQSYIYGKNPQYLICC